ncbi:Beta-phosphoglucomutase [compost metagenome]
MKAPLNEPDFLPGEQAKACLFDLDGVLVDTAGYHFKAWRKLANKLGFDFTEVQNEELKGISRMESLNKILGWGGIRLSETEKERLAAEKNNDYVAMISTMTPVEVLPGAVRFLEDIKAAGYRIALGSASKNAGLILARTGLEAFFDEVVDGNRVSRSKPDPEVFLAGARMLQVEPACCIVFEDAVAGIEAARRAGMKAIGIGDAAVLQKADIVVPGLDHLTVAQLTQLNEF